MRLLALVLACLALVSPLAAAVHEVSTPQEFAAKAQALQPGDELVVKDGVYADWKVEVPASGAEGRPVVVRPATPGGVLLRRQTAIALKGSYVEFRGFAFDHCGPGIVVLLQGSRHIRVTACRFTNCGNPRSTFGHIVEVEESTDDARVDHCMFEGSKSMSIGLRIRQEEKTSQRPRFDHNTFRDIWHLSYNGQEPIQLGQGGGSDVCEPHALVEYNLFDNASGDAELISNKSSCNLLRYNVAANCRASLVLRGGSRCRVEGNVLARNACGIRIHGAGHAVVNNLCYENAEAGISMPLGGGNHAQAENCLVAYNTLVNNGAAEIALSKYQSNNMRPKGNRILNNVLAGRAGTLLDLNGAAENEVARNLFWATDAATCGDLGRDPLVADPRLEGAEGDLHPAAGSPVVDAATALPEVTCDRVGRLRPAGKGPDIGADEVGSALPAASGAFEPLPRVPAPRPPLDWEALKGDALFAANAADAAKGWKIGAGDVKADAGVLRTTDATLWLLEELPADFIAEWDYRPGSLDAKAFITFAAPDKQGGYRLGFGGKKGKDPDGAVTLAKNAGVNIVADGHDVVLPAKPKDPIPDPPDVWYRCRLLKRGGELRLEMGKAPQTARAPVRLAPVLLWTDTGAVDGPALGGGAFGLQQVGAGAWRNVRLWRVKPA